MDLTKFANLLAENSVTTAKNTLSYLIGNGKYNNNWGLALAELYRSFPDSVKDTKENKKEFLPVVLKYFYFYDITKDNIDIFNEYIDLFPAKDKDAIKEKNKNWVWDNEPEVIFKNSFAFARAVPNRNSGEGVFKFVSKYQDQINGFISSEKGKSKFDENFEKNGVWTEMI